ncbi:MAG: hypothetical protein JSS81_19995 [Acidobacteria bacterium]|nr:hypothetical protein [Acidobacteriota bacterium]
MTYKLKNINTSRHIVCFSSISGSNLYYALIKANEKDIKAYCRESDIENLLLDAVKLLPDGLSVGDFPKMLADAVETVLTKRVSRYPDLFHVSYVGIALSKNTVYVCTAGNCRVHLIKNDLLVSSTRDHNLIEEPVEGMGELSSEPGLALFYKCIETRQIVALKSEVRHRAESIKWEPDGGFTILVCSESFHRFQEPENYIRSLLRMIDENRINDETVQNGLISRIDYSA